jgi:NADH-quinone oxidoreductase subunit F
MPGRGGGVSSKGERPLTEAMRPGLEPLGIEDYVKSGGYRALERVLRTMKPGEVTAAVKESTLMGRGGAGFSTGIKWSFVPMGDGAPRPKYFVVNADEKEPGSFKDRILLEGNPHQLIEGLILAAYAIQAEKGVIFLRAEYTHAERSIRRAVEEAAAGGYIGANILGSGFDLDVSLHMSVGRYMCGEETGLLNALEGRRATPRAKPPYPQLSGLFGKPTVVNNVETLSNIPHILGKGAAWFRGLSLIQEGGTKIYSVSGRAKSPGWWELPMGTSLREILEEKAGGMLPGVKLRGLLPGGASTDFLGSEQLDLPMGFEAVQKAGSRLGTGTVILLDDRTCPVGFVLSVMNFFVRESCGWCTPCREGIPWIAKILAAIERGEGEEGDLGILEEQAKLLGPGNTYCAFAPGAMEPLRSALRLFGDDFREHIRKKKCPWR